MAVKRIFHNFFYFFFIVDLRETVANFHGRENVINKIKDELSKSSAVVVSAMGGCGKTQTVAKFVQIHKNEYDNVFWMKASNIQKSLTMIARQLMRAQSNRKFVDQENLSVLELSQMVDQLVKGTKILYVVDNVFKDDLKSLDILIRNCVSTSSSMLITTQLPQFSNDQVNQSKFIRLPHFTKDESICFLKENLKDVSDDDIEKLSSELGNFPLCLQQTVSYINKHNTEVSTYIANFQKCRKSILNPKGTLSDYDKTLLTVWDIALEKLKSSPKALIVLSMMCLMDNSCIRRKTFLFEKNIAEDEIELNEIVDILSEYSLIQHSPDRLYIHSLTQKVIGTKAIEFDEKPLLMLKRLLEGLASQIKDDEFHADEDDLWYIHYNKIMMSHPVVEDSFNEYDLNLVLRVSSNRSDIETTVHHLQRLFESAKNLYKSTKSSQVFLHFLHLKTAIICHKQLINMIDYEEIVLFEDEFKKGLKLSHPIIYQWKIARINILIQSPRASVVAKDIIPPLYQYFDEKERQLCQNCT